MAIQVNGTTVIDNSRQLTNIASVDSTTVAALGAAGVGGGEISFVAATSTLSGSFTKPADAYSITNNLITNFNDTFSGRPADKYRVINTAVSTGDTIVDLTYTVQNPNTFSLRSGGYWGDEIIVGIENTSNNTCRAFANIAAGWTSQTSFPVTWNTGLVILKQNERACIWISDAYTGGQQYNSNLVLGSGDAIIKLDKLAIT